MTLARLAELAALLAAALATAARSRLPPLRPLAACLALLAAVDAARLASPPRCLDVALCATWWPCLTLAAAGPLVGHWRALAAAAAGAWAVSTARLLAPPWPIAPTEWAALWALSAAAQVGAVAWWARRAWRRREAPSEGQVVALVVVAGSLADAAGPWAWGAAWAVARWEVGRWQSVVTWMGVVGVAGWGWLRGREKKQR